MVPGNTLNTHQEKIAAYVSENKPMSISVNFVADDIGAFAFFGNQKRYNRLDDKRKGRKIIVSSNVKSNNQSDIVVNYHSLINRGYEYFENSTIMLFKLLKRLNPKIVSIAGFDGFSEGAGDNYADSSFQNERHVSEFKKLNSEIRIMFNEIVETMSPDCKFKFLTPSIFDRKGE